MTVLGDLRRTLPLALAFGLSMVSEGRRVVSQILLGILSLIYGLFSLGS